MSQISRERRQRIRRGWPWGLVALAVAAAAVGWLAWRSFHPSPAKLLQQAIACGARDPDQAERLLQTAIVAAGGRFPDAEMALCRRFAERGDWQSALPLFEALDLTTCPSDFLTAFGELALKERRTPEALTALSEVRRRKSPERARALELLFSHYREQNQERDMLDCLRERAELDGRQPGLWWKLLEMLDVRQLDMEYMTTLRAALQQNLPARDKTEMQHRLVARLVDQGDAAPARRELAPLAEHEGLSARVRLHQAAICRLEGKPQEALEMLQASFQAVGERQGLVRLRALIFFDLGRYLDAAEDFQQEVKQDPFDLVPHFKLAEAHRKLGNLDLARKHQEISDQIRGKRQKINKLRETVKGHPADRQLCEQLAELYRDLNDTRAAKLWEDRANQIRATAEKP